MREIRFSNAHDATMYNKGYEQGRTDAIAEIDKAEEELVHLFKKEKDIWTIRLAFAQLRQHLKEQK